MAAREALGRRTGVTRPTLREIESAFEQAAARPPGRREDFARDHFGDQPELLSEVLKLLRSDREAGAFLSTPALDLKNVLDEPANLRGVVVGSYTITERIGAGGMGSVWAAERSGGEIERRVAVKVIRAGGERLLSRFRLEQRALAALEHPGIARLIDVARLPDGQPAILMELVDGIPIDMYCRDHELDLRQRVELFASVCDAVTHAHRRLIVHRDLKPSNILVTEEGVPKLIDFGIAKLLSNDQELTETDQRMLTPRYASPEQILGEPVGVGSDVYALGVVLYELLTGANPHDASGTDGLPIQQVICDETPPRPSAVHARVSGRSGGARSVRRELSGDLDVIVMAALRKEPDRRYPGADALADDLRRYLTVRPVEARPDTLMYRARKFARRNTGLVISSVLGVASIAAALAVISLLYVRATDAEREQASLRHLAEERASDAEAIASFLQGMLLDASPDRAAGQDPAVLREMLMAAERRLGSGFDASLAVRAEIERTLGAGFREIGEFERSRALLTSAEQAAIASFGEQSPEVAFIRADIASLAMERGDIDRAGLLIDGILPVLEPLTDRYPARLGNVLGMAGMVYALRHENERATDAIERAGELLSSRLAPSDPAILRFAANRASLAFMMRDMEAAEAGLREAISAAESDGGPVTVGLLTLHNNLAVVLSQTGRVDDAQVEYARSIELSTGLLGDRHPMTVKAKANRASLVARTGSREEGELALREALVAQTEVIGPEHPDTIATLFNLGRLLLKNGEPSEAVGMFETCLRVQADTYGRRHPETAMTQNSLAESLLLGAGAAAEAEPLLREARTTLEATLGPGHPITQDTIRLLRTLYGLEHLDRPEALQELPSGGEQKEP